MIRLHKHLRVRAYVENPLFEQSQIEDWLRRLCAESIDMKIMAGPQFYYAESEINRGWTATAIIEFSHLSLHIWELEGLIEFDVFSCKDFPVYKVMDFIKEFNPKEVYYDIADRSRDFTRYYYEAPCGNM